jgi:hypothetical protein
VFLANDGRNNQYFRNDGGFLFTPILTTDISDATANSFSCAWADIDNDADLDLFVTNAFKAGTRMKNLLYINDGTGHLVKNNTEAVTIDQGWSYGCAFGDYDNNGCMDLAVATTRFGNADDVDYLYHNEPNGNHFFMIGLEGTTSNKSAIGAIVRIKATIDGQAVWQMREVSAQSGYCGQNDMRVHVGLGTATTVDSVIIKWPSGNTDHLTNLIADQILYHKETVINGIPALNNTFSVAIFPNPASTSITIRAAVLQPIANVRLEITNDTGVIVHRDTVGLIDNHWEMNISCRQLGLAPGIYFARLVSDKADVTRTFIYSPK